MQNFAQGRSGSPQQGRANSSNRRHAQSLKVPTAIQGLSHNDHAQQRSARLPERGGPGNVQAFHPQQQQRAFREDHNDKLQPGRGFDTDAESIDTTMQGRSEAPLDYGQEHQGQHDGQLGGVSDEDAEDGDDNQGSQDEEEEEDGDHEQYDDRRAGFTDQELLRQQNLLRAPPDVQRNFLESLRNANVAFTAVDGDSYPPTTDGFPSDGLPSDDQDDGPLDTGMPFPTSQATQIQSQPQSQPAQAMRNYNQPPPAQPAKSIYQQSAELRQGQRSDPKRATTAEAPQQAYNPLLQGRQQAWSGQGQYDPPKNAIASAAVLAPRHPGNPQRGGRQPSGPTQPPKQPKANATATHGHKDAPSRSDLQPSTNIAGQGKGPSEDYDLPDLYKMNYEQLKNQDFDDDPRAGPQVLSDDMLAKPLEERLGHVKDKLDAADQGKFFRSLPTKEWEDAGDWFLEEFTSIIKKTQEARQEKRKLARGFEDEVERRHRRVAKRQKNVDEALKQMKTQGIGLLQSPRRGN